jgi:hypothetical protein
MSVPLTVITKDGKVVGASLGHHAATPEQGRRLGQQAGLIAGPGQTLHHITVPDELAQLDNPEEFRKQLEPHFREHHKG